MTLLEYFEKQVKQHTESLDSRTKDTALVWDLWCALQELSKEHDTLREAYGRLMRGVEEKINPARWPVVETPPPLMREPALGPLGMGSAEGIKNQAGIYKVWKALHDGLRAQYPDLPDLTPIMQGSFGEGVPVAFRTDKPAADIERGEVVDGPNIPHNPVREVTSLEQAKKEFGPDPPAEWFVWAIDRLREDSKDGNFHRSYRFAQELLKAIDDRGYALVKKERT